MQVTVETVSELRRKMTVRVPGERVREQMERRLGSLASSARVDGFRPGKAPRRLLEQRYGASLREEVVGEMISESLGNAFRQENLNPAGPPRVTPVQLGDGGDLEYVADFDIYPDIQLKPLESLSITRPTAEISAADVDVMIEQLRGQRRVWKPVKRKSKKGDQVTIRFEGQMGGESFTSGQVDDFVVVLGAGQLIDGFEKQLTKRAVGDTLEFSLPFPADYFNEELRGKTGDFSVEVQAVAESCLPEVDEAFVRAFGVESGDVAAFRADVRANMEQEKERASLSRLKSATLDALLAANPLSLPDSVVEEEVAHLVKAHQEDARRRHQPVAEDDVLAPLVREVALRRVSLGLLLGEVIRAESLEVDKIRVRAAIADMAHRYEKPEDVMRWYASNPERMTDIEHHVLEDQVVETILAKAMVRDEVLPFARLMNSQDTDETAVHTHDEHCGCEHEHEHEHE